MSEVDDVDIRQDNENSWHFRLRPAERWGISALTTAFFGLIGWVFLSWNTHMQDQGKALADVKTQQAVTNAQLATLTQQLSDMPALMRQIAELQVQTARNTQDIRDLQQVKGLKP